MALQGKFVVNNAHYSPLSIFGVGTFMAFSGNKAYRNRGGCTMVPDNGPLPEGRYWIVERPKGGVKTRINTAMKDFPTKFTHAPTDHNEWFGLYRDDGKIDDYTWINNVERGNFRLHPIGPMGVSMGCITLQHAADFQVLRKALLHTQTIAVNGTKLMAYGCIEVVTYGNTCP
ncbi:DUF2778 domain-containing protein [Yersinia wautersii]|uniref:Membrane protein n=1 Tax=Yersinia wautersii TaxID=1341643 RepID=A0ABM9TBW7_9GAMM|nr:DUF2778 domain-containing protein [Yersinia wautersii]CRG49165.1 membrane protein [Yersinia wautersii]